jgi:molecular chaperone GrpE (heat shock protein)
MFGLGSMERRISGKIEALTERIGALTEKIEALTEQIGTCLSERLDKMDEHLQQSIRQDRRNQAALESVFENQKAELLILRRMRDDSQALKVLMAFAESFTLWRQSQMDTSEFRVLMTKFAALLEQFGLEVISEVGVPFDPSFHEACAARFCPGEPDGYVLEVVRPGFSLDGEVLRCASVVVNRSVALTENGIEGLVD